MMASLQCQDAATVLTDPQLRLRVNFKKNIAALTNVASRRVRKSSHTPESQQLNLQVTGSWCPLQRKGLEFSLKNVAN